MKRSLALFLTVCFIFWILPLGYFIKPSQQKFVCDGQRAMCMCRALVPKIMDKAMEPGIWFKTSPSTNKENSSGSGGNYFVSAKLIVVPYLHLASFFEDQTLSYKNPSLPALESVPKV